MQQIKRKIIIYTDGACRGNPGPGGWGAILIFEQVEKKISGSEKDTTNNKMELRAAIESLKLLNEPCDVELYTDSQYVKNGICVWIHDWIKKDWKSSTKQPVKNKELWQELYLLTKFHSIDWHWVKAHNNNKYNEIADSLARNAINPLLG